MRFLLDTHALIWWWTNDRMLPARAKEAMADATNEILVSAVTGWEIATKVRKGHLLELRDRVPTFHDDVEGEGFGHLAVTGRHGAKGGSLPGMHNDPFDRLIAAQALLDGLIVITRDAAIAGFGCKVLW